MTATPRAILRDEKSYAINELHEGNILLDDREIFVHPHLSRDDDSEVPDTDYRMSTVFLKNIRLLMTHDKGSRDVPILVHFYNNGGEWGCGMEIYDAIATCQTYVTGLIHGDGMSMGSIVPLSCDKVVMMPRSRLMMHDGTTGICSGMTMRQSRSWYREEIRTTKLMLDIYAETCAKGPYFKGWTETRVRNFIEKQMMINEDWIVDAEMAVNYGFAHGVLGEPGFDDIETIKKHG